MEPTKSSTYNSQTDNGSGKWRLVGNDLYIHPEGEEREWHLVLRGNDLIDHAIHEPFALIYERHR